MHRKFALVLSLLFMSILALGLSADLAATWEMRHGEIPLSKFWGDLWDQNTGGALPFLPPALAMAVFLYALGAVGLEIPLFIDRDRLRRFGGEEGEKRMNLRLFVLQTFLAVSAMFGFVYLDTLAEKLGIRLPMSFGVVLLLKFLMLVPEECRFYSGFDPRVWYKVIRNKYPDPEDTAAMSAVIGIDFLGLAYGLIGYSPSPWLFPIGAFFLVLFAYRGYKATGAPLLLAWTILNICYFKAGIVKLLIIYC